MRKFYNAHLMRSVLNDLNSFSFLTLFMAVFCNHIQLADFVLQIFKRVNTELSGKLYPPLPR